MSDMELGELGGERIYNPQDVVWVKLSGMWWPAEVQDQATLDPEVTEGLKKPPLCVVQFLLESSYLHIKSLDQIYHYNCRKKKEFLILGFKKYSKNKNEKNVSIWPDVIQEAERRTGGDPNIINDPEIVPVVEKPDAAGRPGSSGKRFSLPGGVRRGQGSRLSLPVGHFSSGSINGARLEAQSFSDDDSIGIFQHSRVYFVQRCPPKDDVETSEPEEFYCKSCDLKTFNLERYIIHFKMKHVSYARSQPPPRPRVSLPGPSKPKKERKRKEESASPIVKKKKKKSVVPKEQIMPQPEMNEQPPSALERSMECEQILKDWSDEDEETKEGDKSPPEEIVVVENTALQPTNEPENSIMDKNGTSDDSVEPNLKTVEVPAQPPKSSSCFDFDDEESTQPEVQTLKFGQKLPRVISPEKSKSSTADILSDGLESFLNEVAVPELPSIPSLKHASSSTKGIKEEKKPITSSARETEKKTKDPKEGALHTSSNQTPDGKKDATPEIKSEDKHFLVGGPLQSQKRKGSGLTEGAEDGSAGKKQKSDDEPSKKDYGLETGGDGPLEKHEPETLVVEPTDSKLVEPESPGPVKFEIIADLNDSKLSCDVPPKNKSTISELDKQSLIDTLTYSPSSVDNDFSQKKRKKTKDESPESSQGDDTYGKGGIVSELDKQSLIDTLTHSPAPVDSTTPPKKKMRRKSRTSPKTPKLESRKSPETSKLRSGSKEERLVESESFPSSSRSRSSKSRGSSKTQTKEKHIEASPSPDAKLELKSPRSRKSRHSRRDVTEEKIDDSQAINEGTPLATANSAASSKPKKMEKSRKSLEKNDNKSSLDQALNSKLQDSFEKNEDNISNDSTMIKDTSGVAAAVETGSIVKEPQSPSSSDQNETIIGIEKEQNAKSKSGARHEPSLETEVVEDSIKEQDSKKEAKSEDNGDPNSDVLSISCLAESDLSMNDATLQTPLENSKIALEKNEFLEVSKLMPLKQDATPKSSVEESSNSFTPPSDKKFRLEKEQETKKSTDIRHKDLPGSVGKQAAVVQKLKKSQDECQKSDSPKKYKNKEHEDDTDIATHKKYEKRSKEPKHEPDSKRSKVSNRPSEKSPSKTVTPTDSIEGKHSRSKRSSRSDERRLETMESTSSSCVSNVPTTQEVGKDTKNSTHKEDKGHSRSKRSSRSLGTHVETTVESNISSFRSGVPTSQETVKDLSPKEEKGHSGIRRSSRSSDPRVETAAESKLRSNKSGVPTTQDGVKDPKGSTPREDMRHSRNKRSSRSSNTRVDTSLESSSSFIRSDVPTIQDAIKGSKDSTPTEDKRHSRSKRSSRSSHPHVETGEESKTSSIESGVLTTQDATKDAKDSTPKEDKRHSRSKRSSRSSHPRVETGLESKTSFIESCVPTTQDASKDSKDSTPKENKGHCRSKRSSRFEASVESKSSSNESGISTAQEAVKNSEDSTPKEDKGLVINKQQHSHTSDSILETTVESNSSTIGSGVPSKQDTVKDSKDITPKEDKGLSRSKRSSRSSNPLVETAVESKSSSIKSGVPTTQDTVKDSKDSTPKGNRGHSRSKRSSRSSNLLVETAVESNSSTNGSGFPSTQDVIKDSKHSTPKEGHSRSKRSSHSPDTSIEEKKESIPSSFTSGVPTSQDDINDSKDSTQKEDKGDSRSKRSSPLPVTTVQSKERTSSPSKDSYDSPAAPETDRQAKSSDSSHSDHTKADVIKSSKHTSKDKRNLEAATSNTDHVDELLKSKRSTRLLDSQPEVYNSSASLKNFPLASPTRIRLSSLSLDSPLETPKSVVSTTKEPKAQGDVPSEAGTPAVSEESVRSINKFTSKSGESQVEYVSPCKRIIPKSTIDDEHSIATTTTDIDDKEHSRTKRSSLSRYCRDGGISSASENSSPAIEIAKDGEHVSAAALSASDERDLPGTNLLYVPKDTFVNTVVPNSSAKKGGSNLKDPKEVMTKSEIETSDSMSIQSENIPKRPSKAGIVRHSDEMIGLSKTESMSGFQDGKVKSTDPLSSPGKNILATSKETCEDGVPRSKKAKLTSLDEFEPSQPTIITLNVKKSDELGDLKVQLDKIDGESPSRHEMGTHTDNSISEDALETSASSNKALLVDAYKLSSDEGKQRDRTLLPKESPKKPANEDLQDKDAEDSIRQMSSNSSRSTKVMSEETILTRRSSRISSRDMQITTSVVDTIATEAVNKVKDGEQAKAPVTSNQSTKIQEMKPPYETTPLRESMGSSCQDAKSISAAEASKVPVPSVDFDSHQVKHKTVVQLNSLPETLSSNEAHYGTAKTALINQESSQDQKSALAITPQASEPSKTSDLNIVKGESDITAICDADGSITQGNETGITIATSETKSNSPQNDVFSVDSTYESSEPVVKESLSSLEKRSSVVKTKEIMGGILPCHSTSGELKTELSTGETTRELKSNETNFEKDSLLPSPSSNLTLNPESEFTTSLECRKMEKDVLQLMDSQMKQPPVPSLSDLTVEKDNGQDSSGGPKESKAECPQVGSVLGEVIVLPKNESIAPAGSPMKAFSSLKEDLQKVGDAPTPSLLSSQRLESEFSKLEAEKTLSPTKSVSSCISPEESKLPNVPEKVEPKMLELPQAPLVSARASRWDNPFPMKKSDTRPSTPTNLLITSPTKMSLSPVSKVKVEIKSGLGRSCFKSPPPDPKCTTTDAKQVSSDVVIPQTVEVGSDVIVETTHPERTATASDFDDELSALQAEIASYSKSNVQIYLPKPDPSDEMEKVDSFRHETTEVCSIARDLKTDKIEKTVEGNLQNVGTPQARSPQKIKDLENSLGFPLTECPNPPEIKLKEIPLPAPKVVGLSEAALLASLLKGDDDEEPIQQSTIKVNVASPKKEIFKPLPSLHKNVQSPAETGVFEKPDDNNRGLSKSKSNLLRPIVTNLADIPVVISSIPLPLSEPVISSSQQAPIVIPVEAPKDSTQNQVPNKLCLDNTPTSRVEVLEVERSQPQAGLVGGIDPSKLLDINDIPFVLEEDLIEEGLMPSEPSSMQTIVSNMDSISSTVVTKSSPSYAMEKTNIVSSTAMESEETFSIEDLVEEVVEEEPATDSTLSGNVVSENEFTTDETYEDKIYEARQVRQIFIEVTDESDPNYEFLCSLPIAPFGKYAVNQASNVAQTPTPAKKVVDVPPIQPKRITTVTTEPKLVSLGSVGKLASGVSGVGTSSQIIRVQTVKSGKSNVNISSADFERQKLHVASSSQPEVLKKEPLQLRMIKDTKTGATKFMVKPHLVQQRSKTGGKQLVMSQQMKSIVKSPGSVVATNTLGVKNPSLIQINKGPLSSSKLVPRGTSPSILGQRRVVRQPVQTQRPSSIPIQRPTRSKLTSDLLVGSSTVRVPSDHSGLILSNNNLLPEISPANQVLLSGSNQILLKTAPHQPTVPKFVSFVVNKPPEPKKPGKDLLEQALTGLDVQNEEAPNIMPTATVVYGMLTDPIQQRPIMTTAVQPSQVIVSHDQLLTFETPNDSSSAVSETNR